MGHTACQFVNISRLHTTNDTGENGAIEACSCRKTSYEIQLLWLNDSSQQLTLTDMKHCDKIMKNRDFQKTISQVFKLPA
jgi:hypothetical protein